MGFMAFPPGVALCSVCHLMFWNLKACNLFASSYSASRVSESDSLLMCSQFTSDLFACIWFCLCCLILILLHDASVMILDDCHPRCSFNFLMHECLMHEVCRLLPFYAFMHAVLDYFSHSMHLWTTSLKKVEKVTSGKYGYACCGVLGYVGPCSQI